MVCSICKQSDKCVICGKCVHEAGAIKSFQEKLYCNGLHSNCFIRTFFEKYADVTVVKYTEIFCPFCNKRYIINPDNDDKMIFPLECICGAILMDESEYGTKDLIKAFKRI